MTLIKELGCIYLNKNSKTKRSYAIYECSQCKKHITLRKDSANVKKTSRCVNCIVRKNNTRHNLCSHKLYFIWAGQKQRCVSKTHKAYKYYGARGIEFSKEFYDFTVWLKHVESLENAYLENYTIDRIDNNKNYEHGNLRWIGKAHQAQNTRLLRSNNKSGYRGVSWNKNTSSWYSRINVNMKAIFLGVFKDKLDAAISYDTYVVENNLNHTINGVLKSNIKGI